MKTLLAPRTALLQALYEGPGASADVIERLRRSSSGRVRLRQGPASLVLRALEQEGLVRSWTQPARRGRGRPRRFYELTLEGIAEATSQREALRAVIGHVSSVARPSLRERRAMSERLAAALAVSDFALTLRDAPRRPIS